MERKTGLENGIWIGLGILIISFPLFMNLDVLAFRTFDEARNVDNAYEMYRNGNYIVTCYDGKPEMWNTKPPFMNYE